MLIKQTLYNSICTAKCCTGLEGVIVLRLVLLRPGMDNAKYKLLPHRGLEARLVEAAGDALQMFALGGVDDKGVSSVFYVGNIEQLAAPEHVESEVLFTCDDTMRGTKALIISSS